MKLLSCLFVCALLVVLAANAKASLTFDDNNVIANTSDPTIPASNSQGTLSTTFPLHATFNAVAGGGHSFTAIDRYVSSGQTILSLGADHRRVGALNAFATSGGNLLVTATSNDSYSISGYYNVTDNAATGGHVEMFVQLDDRTAFNTVFSNRQVSQTTPNEQFTLGGSGGDSLNTSIGNLTGNLIAGHEYGFFVSVLTEAKLNFDAGASALGNVTLTVAGQPGDFNNNGIVDAGDYVVWRHSNGPASNYDLWRAQYGQSINGRGGNHRECSRA